VRGKNLIGTCRYVTINAHLGYELSRRDDLLTLGNVMLFLYKGSLPWQHLPISKNSPRFRKLGELKQQHMMSDLFDGCPAVFKTYMTFCNSLEFEQMPDFDLLKSMISAAAEEFNLNIFDNVFDWSLLLTRNFRPLHNNNSGPSLKSPSLQ